jgi:folate-dependent phosphoribosylglycinamide formyltransferase PurN
LLAHALQIISQEDWQTESRFSSNGCLEPLPKLPMKAVFADQDAPGVIVFSPNPYSLYTLSVLQLLIIHGVRVQGVVVRRLFNRKRFFQELKRDGVRLLRKIWNKLVLRSNAYEPRNYQTLPQFMSELGVTQKHVVAWASDHNVPVWPCDTLNDDNVLEALKTNQPRAVVFTGGGLVREPVLEASGGGVINTHMGLLPPYRGMDVVEWPILEGRPNQVGLTVHLMTKGLDEGDILVMHYAPWAHTADIVQLRERMEVLSAQASVGATLRFLQGELQARSQVIADGKQYFIIHPRLYELALERYRGFRTTEVER